MIWLGLPVLLLLALLGRECWQILRAQAPAQVRELLVGAAAPRAAADIPKVLWTYWHPAPAPAFIQQCLANWRHHAPDHELRLLDRQSLLQWIPASALRPDFDSLPPYRQADWLRVQLLARHGGIWLDASTLLTRDLAWLHEARAAAQAEYAGFYIQRYSSRAELPIVENWCMAAVPRSAFVRDLAAAFDHALDLGAEAYLDELRAQGRLARVVQDLTPDFQRYLLMHVAASDLLDRAHQASPQIYRLALLRAEDSAFAYLDALRWRKRHLYARLALTPCPRRLPALIKLRGGDRQVLERGLAKGRWLRGSAIARLLDLRA
ncbi:capsular polysaccharide synthesis protein [Paucibacter sediminis]|uniref:Capsular polysaccharide synthesis protein n=1 Tax=Paucibacter sediminis TaxID=3019553 RepID=A0AA95SUN2_9BURK|nr:capsular polysaccharide synthesis protein [Paucibacter sp. S2-9]WIT10744.1 capsular polysaccharide synthesis protein [Paucibacter sp. S2-9]